MSIKTNGVWGGRRVGQEMRVRGAGAELPERAQKEDGKILGELEARKRRKGYREPEDQEGKTTSGRQG